MLNKVLKTVLGFLKSKVLKVLDGLTDILAGVVKIINVFPTGKTITVKIEIVEDFLEGLFKEIEEL